MGWEYEMNVALSIALYLIPLMEGYRGVDGDGGRSWGLYQIGQLYLDDANRFSGCNYTRQDCYDPILARRIVIIYLEHYGKRIGRDPTVEDYARIHNGGPDGWQKNCTLTYWTRAIGHWAIAQRNGKLAEALTPSFDRVTLKQS